TYMSPDKATTDVSITDTGGDEQVRSYMESGIKEELEQNNQRDGYAKALKGDHYHGVERYEKEEQEGGILLLVNDRIGVKIETSKQESKTLQEWLQRIDLQGLSELQ
ncbi:MAG: hypothetical protein M3Y86_09335, partial [Verrucomicrobiota bacterium]|nr:hypothetical protein [Verrucomicrobiota bacterium]